MSQESGVMWDAGHGKGGGIMSSHRSYLGLDQPPATSHQQPVQPVQPVTSHQQPATSNKIFPIFNLQFEIMTLNKVAVYCGSRPGNGDLYRQYAIELADFFIHNNITMVNGGGSVGIMGIMADRMLEQGGKCIGVISLELKERELAHYGMTELITTPGMHERKKIITEIVDAFIAFPGGYGTLDELFEAITWRQLDFHQKPVALLNVEGYFDPVIQMADRMLSEGFMNETSRHILIHDTEIESLFEKIMAAAPLHNDKFAST